VINSFAQTLLHVNTVDEVVWAIAKNAVAQLGYVDCVIYLIDEDSNTLIQSAAHGPKNPLDFDIKSPIILKMGEGICGNVAATGKSELINDTTIDFRYRVDDETRSSEITVPIISHDRVIGVIDSEHPDKNHFNEQDLEILETIASMVSVKLDQAKSQEKLQKHKEELENRVTESTRELQLTIDELKRSNETINQSNLEKEVLLKEIHHRVKNNLQIVSSLLSLHANVSTGQVEKEAFRDCQNRIKSMSIIHEQLYNKGVFTQINMKLYIEEIANQLFHSFDAHDKIKINYELDPIHFNIDLSVPFGIILNELMVNSLKHAFPDNSGVIKITLKKHGEFYEFIVKDDGQGFNKAVPSDSMGLELIDTLVSQIDGTYEMDSNSKGTTCTIKFPLE